MLTLAACEQLPELRYQTEHLNVGTLDDAPLCQGNLELMELSFSRAQSALGVQRTDPVEVYLWSLLQDDPGWCDAPAVGCYKDGVVYTTESSAPHELVHALVEQLGQPADFWNEGAAEALQVNRTRRGDSPPSAELDKPTGELSYRTAGHFARWLIEREGLEQFRQLLAQPGDARAAFESVYDLSFDEAEAAFLVEAPDSYGAYTSCPDPELTRVSETRWSESIVVDCAKPDTYNNPLGMGTARRFTVLERGDYAFVTDAELGTLSRCPGEDYELTPSLDDPATYGDVPAYTQSWINRVPRTFPGEGEQTLFDLTPGEYEVRVGFDSLVRRQAQLSVTLVEP